MRTMLLDVVFGNEECIYQLHIEMTQVSSTVTSSVSMIRLHRPKQERHSTQQYS